MPIGPALTYVTLFAGSLALGDHIHQVFKLNLKMVEAGCVFWKGFPPDDVESTVIRQGVDG